MQKIKELIKNPHVQIALVTAVSIIAMAYFSKRVLPKPIGYLPAAISPFLVGIFEAVYNKNKKGRFAVTWYWAAAILITTAVIIIFYAV
jgi:hypothetical protein